MNMPTPLAMPLTIEPATVIRAPTSKHMRRPKRSAINDAKIGALRYQLADGLGRLDVHELGKVERGTDQAKVVTLGTVEETAISYVWCRSSRLPLIHGLETGEQATVVSELRRQCCQYKCDAL